MADIIALDHNLFLFLNGANYPGALDGFFQFFSDLHRYPWFKWGLLPAGLLLALFRYRLGAIKVILSLALVVATTDLLCYRLIKPTVARSRPARTEGVLVQLRTEKSPSDFSFPSNHATNTMAGAIYLSLLSPILAPVLILYAVLTGFSRIYLGVHFPVDVMAGWIIGLLVALAWHRILAKASKYR